MGSELIVFTDGSCKKNGKKGATGGIGIHFPGGELDDISEKILTKPVTNQRAELFAVKKALKVIIKSGLNDEYKKIIIYSDSKYVINCLTKWSKKWALNGWKNIKNEPIKNSDIIIPLYKIIKEIKKINFIHVFGHGNGSDPITEGNREADKLASDILR